MNSVSSFRWTRASRWVRTVARAAVAFGAFGIGACGAMTFTPTCNHPKPGVLSSPIWGGVQPASDRLVVVSADLEERYCAPYVSVFTRTANGGWDFTFDRDLPQVSVGVPGTPIAAVFLPDGALAIADRRGERILTFDPTLSGVDAKIHLGFEVGPIAYDGTRGELFAADTTQSRFARVEGVRTHTTSDDRVTILSTESALAVASFAVRKGTLYLGYRGGTYLSRFDLATGSWGPIVLPFEGTVSVDPDSIVFDDAGVLWLALPTARRVARLASDDGYRAPTLSPVLGRPERLFLGSASSSGLPVSVLVHDTAFGDLWLDATTLEVTAAVAGAPANSLTLWVSDGRVGHSAAARLIDKGLTTW